MKTPEVELFCKSLRLYATTIRPNSPSSNSVELKMYWIPSRS